PKTKRL
ncbi:3-Oxoacyl-[acyl-carrier-(ACP)] synthase III C terminal family protein, partial [Vibrio parahaemolyticus EKP-021]